MSDYMITGYSYELGAPHDFTKMPEDYHKYIPKLKLFDEMIEHLVDKSESAVYPDIEIWFGDRNEAIINLPFAILLPDENCIVKDHTAKIVFNFEEDAIYISSEHFSISYQMLYTFSASHIFHSGGLWLLEVLKLIVYLQYVVVVNHSKQTPNENLTDFETNFINPYVEMIFYSYLAASSQSFKLTGISRDRDYIQLHFSPNDNRVLRYTSVFHTDFSSLRVFSWSGIYAICDVDAYYRSDISNVNVAYPWHLDMLYSEIANSISQFKLSLMKEK